MDERAAPLTRPAMSGAGSRKRLALLFVSTVVVLVACAVEARRLDWYTLRETLAGARLPWVAASAAAGVLQFLCKAARWRLMMAPVRRLSLLRLFRYLLLSDASSILFPGPLHEALRVYLLRRHHDVPVATSFAVLATEKLFEGAGIMCVVAPLPLLLALPRTANLAILGLVTAGAATLGASVVLVRRAERAGWSGRWARWARFAPGVACLNDPGLFARAVGWSCAARIVECACIDFLFASLRLEVPWAASGLVLLALAFAMLIPMAPGHIGTFEAGFVGALGLARVPLAPAVACALVYHAVRVVPVAALGLAGFGLVAEERVATTS